MATLKEINTLVKKAVADEKFCAALLADPDAAAKTLTPPISLDSYQAADFLDNRGQTLLKNRPRAGQAKDDWISGASVVLYGCKQGYGPGGGRAASMTLAASWDPGNPVGEAIDIALRKGPAYYPAATAVIDAMIAEVKAASPPPKDQKDQLDRLDRMKKNLKDGTKKKRK